MNSHGSQILKPNVPSSFRHWMTSAWARFGLPYYYYDTMVKVEAMAMDSGKAMTRRDKWASFIRKEPLMFVHHIILPIIFYPVIIVSCLQ